MITRRKFSGAEAFSKELSILGAEAVPTSRVRSPSASSLYRDWSSISASLPSGMLFHCTSAGPITGYGGTSGGHFGLVMPWVDSQPAIHQGVEMSRNSLSLYGPNTQHVARYYAESAFTVCAFDNRRAVKHIALLLGRDNACPVESSYSVLELPPATRHGFEETVRIVTGLCNGMEESIPCPEVLASIEDRIFNLIAEGIMTNMQSKTTMPRHASRLRMVSTCWELSRQHPHANLTLSDLCVATNASARVINYAFLEFCGITPNVFLRNHRLIRARRLLISGEVGSVKAAAYSCGFMELGRFSAYYRGMFGQLPRETLANPGIQT